MSDLANWPPEICKFCINHRKLGPRLGPKDLEEAIKISTQVCLLQFHKSLHKCLLGYEEGHRISLIPKKCAGRVLLAKTS